MSLYDNKAEEDPSVLEETTLTVTIAGQEYELCTAQNFDWDSDYPKEVRGGPGRNKGSKNLRVMRGDIRYTWSMTLDDINGSLLGTKVVNGVEISAFNINGVEYTTWGDVPPFTITNSNPSFEGVKKVVRLTDCEFTKASGKKALGEVSSVSVEGFAKGGEGLF